MKISTFIAVRDHAQFVAEAIQSVMSQSIKPTQLILIDDGSLDNSLDHAATCRIHWLSRDRSSDSHS
ncbi:MAG: glycosyltransferase [Planctomycetota bacterium]|jgi:glycosyltransferase involved in cell wall biosynthesis